MSTSQSEPIHTNAPEPGPATAGHFYKEDTRRPAMQFHFCPSPHKYTTLMHQAWVATLEVKCSDVPRLIREGFYRDLSNIIKEESYLEVRKLKSKWDEAFVRWYFLADTHQPRRWIAALSIKALDAEILYNFHLNWLSRNQITNAKAWSQDGQYIYLYFAHTLADMSNNLSELPMEAYNMIYDKLPMEGWWPWPRKENEDDLNHSHEGDCEKDGSGSLQKCTVQHKVRLQENLIDIEAELNMKK